MILLLVLSFFSLTTSGAAIAYADGKDEKEASKVTVPLENTAEPGTFAYVNQLFHQDYQRAKDEIRKSLGPVIVCTGDTITLVDEGKTESRRFVRNDYTTLKEVAHITLGTYVILTNHTDKPLDKDTRSRLLRFREAIAQASPSLSKSGFSSPVLERQEDLKEKTFVFIDKVVKKNLVSADELRDYARSVSRADLDNAYEAVSSQLSTIDSIVSEWRRAMGDERFNALHVVLVSGHMPRQQLSNLQYFSKLLHVKKEGQKIITMESAADTDAALELLVTHILDGKVAVDFFKDPWRMHRDLLSDGAAKYLKRHRLGKAR